MISRFILGHGVFSYFIMQSLLETTAKTHLSARKAAIRHLILSKAAAIIANAKSYYLSTMSILSAVRYFLLLNQFRAGDIFTNYSYGCWVG